MLAVMGAYGITCYAERATGSHQFRTKIRSMNLNPFDRQLESAKQKVSDLSASLKIIRQDIEWYEGTELATLTDHREALYSDSEAQSRECDRLGKEAGQAASNFRELSQSIKSLWNPKNWFDSEQRNLRSRAEKLKESVDKARKRFSQAQERFQNISRRVQSKTEEIEKYQNFDFDDKCKKRTAIALRLSQKKKKVELIARKKQQVDAALEPIISQIKMADRKKSEASSAKRRAQELDKKLSGSDNSYERAMAHQACEEQFGTGSPRKVISKMDSELRRLDRDLKKLHARANNIAEKASRVVRKLVLDGNNLCYEGDTFIGLDALRVLVPTLADSYDVIVVFDASIRRTLNSRDSKIRNVFEENVKIHVVATSVKADETVIDLAGSDKAAFIISNDRFAEFGEKAAVIEQRIIRHEIVAGQVLIHDLGVSETYQE